MELSYSGSGGEGRKAEHSKGGMMLKARRHKNVIGAIRRARSIREAKGKEKKRARSRGKGDD